MPIIPAAPSSPEATVTLTGTVVDYSGAPVRDAKVSAFPLTRWTADWSRPPSSTDSVRTLQPRSAAASRCRLRDGMEGRILPTVCGGGHTRVGRQRALVDQH